MKKLIKTSLIISAVALLAGLVALVWFASRPVTMITEHALDTSQGPAFVVQVVMPRTGLPFGGILPDALVKKFDGTPRELRFDNASPGAHIGSVENNRLELSADGWKLLIEADGEGRITSGTHLVFPLGLGGRRLRLNCRPADPPNGYLHTHTRVGLDAGGSFLVELATCENAESGKTTNWPPAPLTVGGSFEALPRQRQ